ncbi:MAG TPA: photosystem II complex extrinsic protein PsbU [Allocoleopsis sp.]
MKRVLKFMGSLLSCVLIACLGCFIYISPVMAGAFGSQTLSVVTIAAQPDSPGSIDLTACPEFDQKIDLNNANIVAFTECQGFYPTLAKKIIENSPYEKVEDVLNISGLSDRQKDLLQSQLKNFKVSEPQVSLEMRMPPRTMMR